MRKALLSVIVLVFPLIASAQSPAGFVVPHRACGQDEALLSFEGAGFVKAHISELSLQAGDSLVLYGGGGDDRVFELRGPASGPMWLPSVNGSSALLRVEGGGGSSFSLDKAGIGTEEQASTEKICGNDDRLDPACYDASARSAGDKVGRIMFEYQGLLYYCTGFLVHSDGLFVTNQHCIQDAETAESAEVRWKYESPSCGSGSAAFDSVSSGAYLVALDQGLDIALMKFASDNPAARYGYLTLDDRELEKDEPIWIPQHPMGGPKKFAVHSDSDGGAAVLAVALKGNRSNQAIGYNIDTEAGSSGAPVLDPSNKVVAVHTFSSEYENCENYSYNRGIKMQYLYPVIEPHISSCSGTPPEITKLKYSPKNKVFKLTGTGFNEECRVLVDGISQSTILKGNGKLACAMYDRLLPGDTVRVQVFDPATGCTGAEFFYTRP